MLIFLTKINFPFSEPNRTQVRKKPLHPYSGWTILCFRSISKIMPLAARKGPNYHSFVRLHLDHKRCQCLSLIACLLAPREDRSDTIEFWHLNRFSCGAKDILGRDSTLALVTGFCLKALKRGIFAAF